VEVTDLQTIIIGFCRGDGLFNLTQLGVAVQDELDRGLIGRKQLL